MPRISAISTDVACEVAGRRARGEPWKVIANDLRRRGLPAGRATLWRAVRGKVAKHRDDCAPTARRAFAAA